MLGVQEFEADPGGSSASLTLKESCQVSFCPPRCCTQGSVRFVHSSKMCAKRRGVVEAVLGSRRLGPNLSEILYKEFREVS
jgi:hypothetical protein